MQPEWKKVAVLSKFLEISQQERNLQEALDVDDYIRMDHKEGGANMKNWVDSTQDRNY